MHLLRTLPESELLLPDAIRMEGERYWSSVELPLHLDAMFILCVGLQAGQQAADVWLLVVGAGPLLDTLERVGVRSVKSLQLVHGEEEPGRGVALTPLVRIEAVHDAANPCDRRVRFCTANRRELLLPLPDAADQTWVNSGGVLVLDPESRLSDGERDSQ